MKRETIIVSFILLLLSAPAFAVTPVAVPCVHWPAVATDPSFPIGKDELRSCLRACATHLDANPEWAKHPAGRDWMLAKCGEIIGEYRGRQDVLDAWGASVGAKTNTATIPLRTRP